MGEARPALFLGRDGVICAGGAKAIGDVHWMQGAADCVAAFNARGWLVFIVANAGEDWGELSDVQALHAAMLGELARNGARVDRIYVSPADAPRSSYDRMPRPGLLMRAMTEFQVERERSLLIGGGEDEIAAAKAAGVRAALFTGGDLATFAEWALADDR